MFVSNNSCLFSNIEVFLSLLRIIIVGLLFFTVTHNPSINFTTKEITFKSNYCLSNCLILPNSFVTNSQNIKSDKSNKPYSKNNNNLENPSGNKPSCNTSCFHSVRTKSSNSQPLKNNNKPIHVSNSCVLPSKNSCNPVNLGTNSCNTVNLSNNSCNPSNQSFSSDNPNSCLKSYTQNQPIQNINLSKPNNPIFSKESVNDKNKSNSYFYSKSNKYSTCQNFFLANSKEIINNSSYFVICNSKSIKYKRKQNNKFKEFKVDAYLPYEDKPPENLLCYFVKNKSK